MTDAQLAFELVADLASHYPGARLTKASQIAFANALTSLEEDTSLRLIDWITRNRKRIPSVAEMLEIGREQPWAEEDRQQTLVDVPPPAGLPGRVELAWSIEGAHYAMKRLYRQYAVPEGMYCDDAELIGKEEAARQAWITLGASQSERIGNAARLAATALGVKIAAAAVT